MNDQHAKHTRQAINHYLEAQERRNDDDQREAYYLAKTHALRARDAARHAAEREIAQAIIHAVDIHQPIDSLKKTNNPR